MKSTTGVEVTACCIFARTSWLIYLRAMEPDGDASASAGTRAGARSAVNYATIKDSSQRF